MDGYLHIVQPSQSGAPPSHRVHQTVWLSALTQVIGSHDVYPDRPSQRQNHSSLHTDHIELREYINISIYIFISYHIRLQDGPWSRGSYQPAVQCSECSHGQYSGAGATGWHIVILNPVAGPFATTGAAVRRSDAPGSHDLVKSCMTSKFRFY